MDDRRFDSLVKSLARGGSRRSVLKGMLGLGGAAVASGTLLDNDASAARRETPTPTPVKCPGKQIPVNGVCKCPDTAPDKCGSDCCTGGPTSPTHSECCDNACCFGTCYGEELCCPTNPGPGQQPPTHQVCQSAQGAECCPAGQDCCEVDGCCDTVCWGGENGNSNCCPAGAFCPGDGTPDICCTNDFICCGAGTSGNLCRDPNVENGCCTTDDCPSGQTCEDNICVTPCTETVPVYVHAPSDGCHGGTSLVGVPVEIYDCESGNRLYGPVSSNNDGYADFESIPPGTYCTRVPEDSPYNGCQVCQDNQLYWASFEVVCGRQTYPVIGICQEGEHCSDGICEVDDPCDGRCSELEVCYDYGCYCGPGTYDDFQGNCVPCSAGSYSDGLGQVACQPCPPNTYQLTTGQTSCIPCPPDTFATGTGNTICQFCQCELSNMPPLCGCPPPACEPGQAPLDGQCAPCAAGFESPDGQECTPCSIGYYASQPGTALCDACFSGTYADTPGSTTCLDCPAGSYAPGSGEASCQQCPCGVTCNPQTGLCPGSGDVPLSGPCQQDSDCASGVCGCGSPPGFPECMCREAECWAEGINCASGYGAVSCCEGDCTCYGGLENCLCVTPI